MYRQFSTYNIRCRACNCVKPKSDFKGSSSRVCAACREGFAKARLKLAGVKE